MPGCDVVLFWLVFKTFTNDVGFVKVRDRPLKDLPQCRSRYGRAQRSVIRSRRRLPAPGTVGAPSLQ